MCTVANKIVHVLTCRHFVSLRKSIIAFLYLRFICFYALNTLFGKHNIKVTEALNFFHPRRPYEKVCVGAALPR